MATENMGPLTLPELNVLLYRLRITMLEIQEVADKAVKVKKPTWTSISAKNTRQEASKLRERIVSALARHPDGLRVSELAGEVASSMEATRYSLKLLRGARKVRMEGKRATTRWYAW